MLYFGKKPLFLAKIICIIVLGMKKEVTGTKINYIDLARFIGIYAVVLGHFAPFSGISNEIGRELLYMFHVPLFFVISGMLSRQASLLKTFCSLMIPYFIYNIISVLKLDFVPLLTFDALELNNAPTWFFAALFFIKIISDHINKAIPVYIVAIVVIVTLLHYLGGDVPRCFGLHAVVYGLPFFLLGKLIKERMHVILSAGILTLCVCVAILSLVFVFYDRFDLYSSQIHDPVVYFMASGLASLFVLALCNRIFPHIPVEFHDYILVNSRGTMFILGTHYILLGVFSKYLFPDVHLHFVLKVLIVCLLSAVYYFAIKITYKRLPFLYGKWQMSKKTAIS